MVPNSMKIEVWGGLEALGSAWGAPWSQDGAQERQEAQEAPRWPTWRQHGPTWLENGVPNPPKIDKKSVQKSLSFFDCFLMRFWRGLGSKIDQKVMPKWKRKL